MPQGEANGLDNPPDSSCVNRPLDLHEQMTLKAFGKQLVVSPLQTHVVHEDEEERLHGRSGRHVHRCGRLLVTQLDDSRCHSGCPCQVLTGVLRHHAQKQHLCASCSHLLGCEPPSGLSSTSWRLWSGPTWPASQRVFVRGAFVTTSSSFAFLTEVLELHLLHTPAYARAQRARNHGAVRQARHDMLHAVPVCPPWFTVVVRLDELPDPSGCHLHLLDKIELVVAASHAECVSVRIFTSIPDHFMELTPSSRHHKLYKSLFLRSIIFTIDDTAKSCE